MRNGLQTGQDGCRRCWWCGEDPLYQQYHDEEWGVPVYDEVRLFEKICLETFQSGLSWLTILRKRAYFRTAFEGFDVARIAAYSAVDIARLMSDAGIVRNRRKIEATITNARAVCAMYDRGECLVDFFWTRLPPASERPPRLDYATLCGMKETPTSQRLALALKVKGFRFVGPVTMYAHMQAMGMVNDHLEGCWRRDPIQALNPK
jgi:DNA-3-methyladenine glycosylase I